MNPTVNLLTRVDMMAAKRPGGAKVLPSYQQLAPTLGLPKAKPLGPVELSTRLAGLIVEAKIVGVGLAQAVPGDPGRPVTVEMLEGFINSGSEPLRKLASYYIEKWSKAVGRRSQQMKDLRGVTPKHVLPPRPTLTGGARWVPTEVDDEVRDVTLATHDEISKKYGIAPLKYNLQLEPGAWEWAYHLAGQIPYVGEHCTDVAVPGLGVAGENIGMDEFGGGGTGRFKVQWTPDHAKMVKKYEGEAQYYDLEKKTGKPGRNEKHYGHFTQLIWRETRFVAVGFAVVEEPMVRNNVATKYFKGRGVWVHRYYPAGNIKGRFAENT